MAAIVASTIPKKLAAIVRSRSKKLAAMWRDIQIGEVGNPHDAGHVGMIRRTSARLDWS